MKTNRKESIVNYFCTTCLVSVFYKGYFTSILQKDVISIKDKIFNNIK